MGVLLLLAGACSLYGFGARGMYHARTMQGPTFSPALPFDTLGRAYPADVLLLLGFAWAFALGLRLAFAGRPPADPAAAAPPKVGALGRLAMLNALLLLSSLLAAYTGGKSGQNAAVVAVFMLVAILQILAGAFLWLFAVRERPRGVYSMMVGSVAYVLGVAVAVLAFSGGN